MRIIFLVRDPRGSMQTRKQLNRCHGNPDCDNPEILCNDLVEDYHTAEELTKKYPARFRYVSKKNIFNI